MGKAFLFIVAAFVGVLVLVTLLRERMPAAAPVPTPQPSRPDGITGIFHDLIQGLPGIISSFTSGAKPTPTTPSVGAVAPKNANDVYRPGGSTLYA